MGRVLQGSLTLLSIAVERGRAERKHVDAVKVLIDSLVEQIGVLEKENTKLRELNTDLKWRNNFLLKKTKTCLG